MVLSLRRWGVFNLVGFFGFLIQIGSIALLTRTWGWSSLAATAVGLELAALMNFFGHSRWTWRDRRASSLRDWLARYWRYQAAKTTSLAANLGITAALAYAGLSPEVANTIAVLICAVPNYLVSEHLVFRYTRLHADKT
jgi:putative flippase GtrA